MKCLALLLFAVVSIALPAQSPSSAEQPGQTTSVATAASHIFAEFARTIDTKDARLGDQISARTTADATLADGTELHKGTRLTGTVIDVHSKSSANPASLLAFTIDRATLQNGQEIRLHSTLTSMSAPAQRAIAEGPPDMEAAATGGIGATPGGRTSGSKSGGGAVRAPSAGTLEGSDPTAVGAAQSNVPTGMGDPRAAGASARGTYVSDAMQVHHYPVANMPGVILSSQVTASISGALSASGQNIRVESGTKMTLDTSISPR
jgi:hypothetical protein